MKSAVIFALAGTSLAVPFGNAIKAIYGDGLEARQATPSAVEPTAFPTGLPSGFPTGLPSGFPSGFPFPSGTGHHHHHHPSGVRPTGSRPSGRPGHQSGRHSKILAIDYKLAPTAPAKYKVEERQVGSGSAALPSFTLANPSDAVPTASSSDAALPTASDAPSFPTPTSGVAFPTESGFPTDLPSEFPTGLPTGGFPHPTGGFPHPTGGFPHPTGGFPHPSGGFPHPTGVIPTTLATFTRGPKPTSMPTQESAEDEKPSWLEWLEGIIGAGNGKGSN